MAGQQTLALPVGVRILPPQPKKPAVRVQGLGVNSNNKSPIANLQSLTTIKVPSSSGPGRRPLTPETRVRFPLGLPKFIRQGMHLFQVVEKLLNCHP